MAWQGSSWSGDRLQQGGADRDPAATGLRLPQRRLQGGGEGLQPLAAAALGKERPLRGDDEQQVGAEGGAAVQRPASPKPRLAPAACAGPAWTGCATSPASVT
ncbi:hypothetical protein ACFQY5_03105 [Paeniroseomonas aquatica]|uniref:hypothetical protein n=1 Tax=Paeniroseomonas aquatica TaxID=373043 RepID=UPI00361119D5